MLKINGTAVRDTPAGIVAVRGARELHMLGTSAAQSARAREMLAAESFDRLYRAAHPAPRMPRVRFVRVVA